LIALALFKKLFKLVLILIAALIIYIAYLAYTGEDIDTKKVKKQIEKSLDNAKEKVDNSSKEIEKSLNAILDWDDDD
jgi:predicted membrane protein